MVAAAGGIVARVIGGIGKGVSWFTVLMVLLTFLIVVLRYFFKLGWIGLQESVTYLHAAVFMLGAAWTLAQDGHVRVDIFYRRHSERYRALIDAAGTLIFVIPFCLYLLWVSWDYVAASWSLREASREAGGLPLVYLLKTLIPLLALSLLAQAGVLLATSLKTLRQK